MLTELFIALTLFALWCYLSRRKFHRNHMKPTRYQYDPTVVRAACKAAEGSAESWRVSPVLSGGYVRASSHDITREMRVQQEGICR